MLHYFKWKGIETMNTSHELALMNEKGILPFKQDGVWKVIYLSRQAEGVCEASFASIFEAMDFAKGLIL